MGMRGVVRVSVNVAGREKGEQVDLILDVHSDMLQPTNATDICSNSRHSGVNIEGTFLSALY